MKRAEMSKTLRAFAFELALYAVFVVGYFFAVLNLLGGWLVRIERENIRLYAVVAILLIIGQAVVLEALTTALMRWLRGGRSE